MSLRGQAAFLGIVLVAIGYAQVSAWDDEDFARFRAEAELAKVAGVRYVVEKSGYREAAYASAFHCRAPVKGERLVMQLANQGDPGKGFRCVYWVADGPGTRTDVTWSRSPELSMHLSNGRRP